MNRIVDVAPGNQWSAGWLNSRVDEIAQSEAASLVEYGVCNSEHIKTENLRANALKAWLEAPYPAGNA
ncbi:MAG: hypothetical protein KF826_03515 [Xanthobacteraceae bacterium]|nr:hypothetical protein [Xanthobacteraceae bacterium]